MIAARTLAEMLLDDPLDALKGAIIARLRQLVVGVNVVSHAGKLDIADMIKRSVADAPAVHVGWTRIRTMAVLDGSADLAVEFAAYIVVADKLIEGKRVERESVALAIGRQLLLILSDIDTATWGLAGIRPPEVNPMPALVPIATIADQEKGAFYCAVTWTQALLDVGVSPFGAPGPSSVEVATDADGRLGAIATFGDGTDPEAVPAEVRGLWQGEVDP